MANNERLTLYIRDALSSLPNVEEKKMFRGIAFLVNDKMCINVASDEIMLRIDPAKHEEAISKKGCSTMIMKGKPYIGYVLVKEDVLQSKEYFDYWIQLALEFNDKAKSSKKKKTT